MIAAVSFLKASHNCKTLFFTKNVRYFFMKLWKTYDFDESGDLDPSEACGLIREMLHNSASNPGMPKLKCKNNLLIIPGSLDF